MFPIIGFPEISSNKSSLYNQFLLQSNLKEIYIKSPLKYVKEIKVPSHVTFKTSQKLTPLFWSFYSIKQAGNGNKTQASFQFSLAGSSWLKWKQNKGNFFVFPKFSLGWKVGASHNLFLSTLSTLSRLRWDKTSEQSCLSLFFFLSVVELKKRNKRK